MIRTRFTALFAGALLLISFSARADMMVPLPIETISARAQLILERKVLSKTVLSDTNGNIYTKVDFQVNEVWKGAIPANHFTIVYDGGVLGDRGMSVSGGVEYEVGEEAVAFLVLNDRGEGITVGLTQGKFRVWTDPVTGEKLAQNRFHGRRPNAPNPPATRPSPSISSTPNIIIRSATPNPINRLTVSDLQQLCAGGVK
jgi:hypothetical protein